ncbi:DUF3857 domain-containing protein [Maribellus sp. YY47]|uniref:DUF3857 domain-containing protein n=1 Tax=Maribellus sp. YY47 TaxID=2929486 RepID=UPI0020011D5B|nr:DUF3857 domain-containing protein [Maribellus sp. YY47]MCK3684069.1 DUF3857 domain-containing protein [Maribellus sp. YY47]
MKLKHLFLSAILLFVVTGISAKDIFYPVSEIADNLLTEANSVTRTSETILEIFSKTKIRYTCKEVITVINENGEGEGILYIPYDSNSEIDITVANFYNKDGELIKKVKKSDVYDQSSFDGFSLYTDGRFKRITPQISTYPYTVEYEFSIDLKGAIDFLDWMPCDSYNKSVEYASYKILDYEAEGVRVKPNKFAHTVENGDLVDGIKTYLWEMKNMEAIEHEPLSVSMANFVPRVVVAPSSFEFYGTSGSMTSWKDFGDWVYGLIADKNNLPEERVQFLKSLTKEADDTAEKVKRVYQFMQEKTRYVSVQLGIGGFQPFPAQKVDEVGYGDCKALTNYMKSMLESIGIDSYYTLVKAGSNAGNIDADFPSQGFNHVILTVPLNSDTIFLECTNHFSPFGFLGSFTSDRNALLVEKNKSRLIRTSDYGINDNTWKLKASIELNEEGNAVVNDTVELKGLQYEYIEKDLLKTHEDLIEDAYKTSEITGAKYKRIEFDNRPDRIPLATRFRLLDIDRLASKMGDRMFIPVNSLNRHSSVPQKSKNRKYPFKTQLFYHDMDSVTFLIPDVYDVEYLPEPVKIETEFGVYKSEMKYDQNLVTYLRSDIKNKGIFPPEKYAEYVQFVKQIVDADNQKMILRKK